ncbi:hypothetical protein FD24_GL001775 [Lactiplantibacillus pentosus DSM 20314]|uniref:Uncharacterized protein n=1 Tax=Lactiplantibacillus pentosus DSM 20314 TaxID=1423791 RepID=A0A837R5L3_LACPE|nr:hypothetical protein FD24_GL001775 [Lactiplantibacillus pentosus DSM 20314]
MLTIRYSSSILTKISKIIGYTAWLIVFLLILLFKTPLGRWVNSLIQARQLAASK